MSQTVITQAFETLKAQEAANGGVVTLDEFVFANVPDLNITDPIDRTEGLPPAAQIVHRQAVSKTGMVNSNAVVYSVVLGADVGDFEFNWVGLLNKTSGVVAMIVHAPSQKKIKTASGQQGNVLTRSFLMEYNGASQQTQIITPADTWQIDFTARLNGVDERVRIENIDSYGEATFLDDGFLVSKSGANHVVKKGVAYVAGLRAELLYDQDVVISDRPTRIWVDVCWQGTMTSVWDVQTKLTVAADLADYTESDIRHHVFAIAEILADGSIKDLRPVSVVHAFKGISPEPGTLPYFDDKAQVRLSALSEFVRNMLSKGADTDLHSYLGLTDPEGAIKYPSLQLARWRDVCDVRGWGAVGDGVTDDTAAFIAAAESLGEGGRLVVPKGTWRLVPPVNLSPVNIVGDGQGKTVLAFDNSHGQKNGVVFSAPSLPDVEFGARYLSIKAVGGHGLSAFYTPRGAGLNGLRIKPTFYHLAFSSENNGSGKDGFSQKYGWQWAFNCGDAWQFSIERIDAAGCYQSALDYRTQFLDGFIRTAPEEGILSMRVCNVTTHNVANFFEVQKKTYFSLSGVDCARALRGVYDAPDRVFEDGNRYAYGETVWTNVIINAQLSPVKMDNRFLLIANGLAIHRAKDGYDHGQPWIGLSLTRARTCSFNGLEIGTAAGYSGEKYGIVLDAGDANNFSNVTFGLLDVGAQIGTATSLYGANHATAFNNVSINADQTTVFDLQSCREFHCDGYSASSAFKLSNFMLNADPSNNSSSFSNIKSMNEYTDNSVRWMNPAASSDEKLWRWDTRDGLSMSTQTDSGAAGNNAFVLHRTGTLIDSIELRTKPTAGAYLLFNAPETHLGGLIKPVADNVYSAGTAAFRFNQVYAGAGSINTSNEEMKIRMEANMKTREAERLAALEIKADIWRFKFKDSVAKKGEEQARIHFGVGAQSVGDILRKHGLDPEEYAFWCKDEWEDILAPEVSVRMVTNEDTGETWEEEYFTGNHVVIKPAGYQYGIRYDQLAFFIMAAM